jgi:hypothetical protein
MLYMKQERLDRERKRLKSEHGEQDNEQGAEESAQRLRCCTAHREAGKPSGQFGYRRLDHQQKRLYIKERGELYTACSLLSEQKRLYCTPSGGNFTVSK